VSMLIVCRDGVHFQYGHLPSARTGIGIAAMAFFSSMGTCQVPIPVLARSITSNGKYSLPIDTDEFYRTLEKCG
jgi:hypothetical protein